jgi:hypothetical protein
MFFFNHAVMLAVNGFGVYDGSTVLLLERRRGLGNSFSLRQILPDRLACFKLKCHTLMADIFYMKNKGLYSSLDLYSPSRE